MKTIYIFAFLLCSLSAFAQRTVVTDTSFISNTSGTYFETRAITYSNGETSTVKTLIGDTLAVANIYLNAANTEGRQLAAAVALVVNRNTTTANIRRYDNTCAASTGRGVFARTQEKLQSKWVGETLSFKDSGVTKTATVTKAGNGTLQIVIGTDAARVFQLWGEGAVRISGYPSGSSVLYLYNLDNKVFSDFAGNTTLTRTTSL
ncbi:MAG: hypothetical protein EBR82_27955 [Caulobacteraceae bacterium]|nr:hypothetical protein [Caulobacteraceae bacterium]